MESNLFLVFNNNVLSGGNRQDRTESNNNLLVNVVNFTKHCNKMQLNTYTCLVSQMHR